MTATKRFIEQRVVTFFSKKNEYRSLSNFWEGIVCIEDADEVREYATGEHCFHGEKFIRLGQLALEPIRRQQLITHGKRFQLNALQPLATALDAKKRGGKGKLGFILTTDELKIWNQLSVDVQIYICHYKIIHHPEVLSDLKKTGDKILVHPALRVSDDKLHECLWDGRAFNINDELVVLGQNRLGYIWMQCRDKMLS